MVCALCKTSNKFLSHSHFNLQTVNLCLIVGVAGIVLVRGLVIFLAGGEDSAKERIFIF